MQRCVLRFNEAGLITLEGFDKVMKDQFITIKIFGYRRVVISLTMPKEILDCHNIIKLHDYKCYSLQLINKLIDAGLNDESDFIFTCDAYFLEF